MRAIVLPSYNKNLIRALLGLKVEEREVKKPSSDEVVIRIHAAPVNPSDIAFMQGGYNIVKTLPSVMGFEGAGTVTDAGSEAQHLIGKKVSCFVQDDSDGTWAEYVVTSKENLIVLDDRMDMDQAACFTVNPFTAYGLLEELGCEAGESIILTAAGGQVPHFVRTLAKDKGIGIINIVRKEETAKKLKEKGEKYVLLETDEHFRDDLEVLSKQLNATSALDAVGGSLTGTVFNALQDDGSLILYGGLSNKPVSGLDNLKIIFNKNLIFGFSLPEWIGEMKSSGDFPEISQYLQSKFIDGTMKTEIRNSVAFEDAIKGIRDYISNMSGGKLLLKP